MDKLRRVKVFQYLKITIILFLIFFGLKVAACFIPDTNVKENIKVSYEYMEKEGLYPNYFANAEDNLYSQRADNFTDSIFLNAVYNMRMHSKLQAAAGDYMGYTSGDNPLDIGKNMTNTATYEMSTYSRQWFGILPILRLLLYFFTFPQIRIISQYAFYILIGICTLLLAKRIDMKLGIIFLVSITFISPDVVAASINLAAAFYVLFISIILMCFIYPNKISKYPFIYIVGAFTSYLDLFSLPFTTVLVVVLLLCLDYKENRIRTFLESCIEMIKLSCIWLLGYLVLWITKWMVASILLKQNVFVDAYNEIFRQSVKGGISWGPKTTSGYITESIRLCVENMFPFNFLKMIEVSHGMVVSLILLIIFIILLVVIFIKYHRPFKESWFSLVLLIFACFPYVCYIAMHTHAFVHFWMWFRIQIISWICLMYAYTNALRSERKTNE